MTDRYGEPDADLFADPEPEPDPLEPPSRLSHFARECLAEARAALRRSDDRKRP